MRKLGEYQMEWFQGWTNSPCNTSEAEFGQTSLPEWRRGGPTSESNGGNNRAVNLGAITTAVLNHSGHAQVYWHLRGLFDPTGASTFSENQGNPFSIIDYVPVRRWGGARAHDYGGSGRITKRPVRKAPGNGNVRLKESVLRLLAWIPNHGKAKKI
ncbi:uncharacterized protein EI90DRAFT_3287369 [Cantharellus anzutake]|uniref:uncharacterized protein n=1 Tax=Cantharellus anzutake TaxID=1750568 RepID=UPI0019057A52|nr:uncharacterized protein EI90DRAFT_3287369 [Cantharellus anzutake]KAF8337075.1 hypothetical protein EI90DRAFT_3287369 [Cantharellus anzutake]